MGGVGVSVIEVAIGCSHAPGKFRVEIVRSLAGEAARRCSPGSEFRVTSLRSGWTRAGRAG